MLSLAELLKAIDKFYRIASNLPTLLKLAAGTPVYEKVTDEVFDQIVNDEFAKEFERYLDVYNELVANLDSMTPQEATQALAAGPEDEGDQTFKDLYYTLANRAEAMRESAYLTQSPADWEESLSPSQIANGIKTIADDALNRIVDRVKGLMTREEVIDRLANVVSGMVMAPTEKMQGESEEDFQHRSNVKRQQYTREYKDKIAALRMILDQEGKGDRDQGAQLLNQYILDLQNKLNTETDAVKKEELERRLRNIPDPKTYQSRLAANQARYERIQADPTEAEKYNARRAPRQRTTRNRRAEMLMLIDQYQKAASPNEKARIGDRIINLREQILLSSSYKLEVENKAGIRLRDREDIRRILNVDNIIKEFTGRKERVKREEAEKYERDKAKVLAGGLAGMIITFRKSVATMVSDKVTKQVNAQLVKTDPTLVQLKQEVEKYPKGDPKRAQADAALTAALNSTEIKNKRATHPAVIEMDATVKQLRDWRDELSILDQNLTQRSAEGGVTLTDSDKTIIIDLIKKGLELKKIVNITSTVKEHMSKILLWLYSQVQQ